MTTTDIFKFILDSSPIRSGSIKFVGWNNGQYFAVIYVDSTKEEEGVKKYKSILVETPTSLDTFCAMSKSGGVPSSLLRHSGLIMLKDEEKKESK